ncbi:tail fiber domain-containing protein [Bacillus sp. 1663tsa1]|uniref:phage tail spike protein n=1 Tax=Bacillus sp. 1663tsa1 TaxID=2953804 RepID=UPI00209F2110|nr:phage tail spike protein [Bacillus sp. 1663tsa1]MCP1181281.1 tail fiber domain-containing protein [Bacillus sp. 1663tsa1]
MRKISGELHIIDYKTQQVIASMKPSEYVADNRHWELQNNVDTLDITILENSKYKTYLQQQNLIIKETRPGVLVPYVITEIEKDTSNKTITIFASGEWVLMGSDDFIKPQKFESMTPEQYIDFATKKTDWERGIVEVTGKRTMTAKEFVAPLSLLSQLPGLFEKKGELRYRVELRGANTIKRKIDFIERRGADKGKEITVGKDLNSVKRTENSEAIITALIPYVMGQDADGNEQIITIESVNNGLPYIVDEDAFQRWNRNGKHRFGFYTPDTDDKNMEPSRLLQLSKTELKKRIDTIVSYEVDAYDISRIPGFSHEAVNEGDTVHIKDITLTPPLYLEARVITGDESHKDNRATKYRFGNYREIVDPNAELRKLYQRILSSLHDKVPKDIFDELVNRVGDTELTSEEAKKLAEKAEKESKVAKDLAEATVDYIEKNTANVIEQPTAPTVGLKDGKTIWVDNSNQNNRVMKLWKNGTWVRITPDTKALEDAVTQISGAVGDVAGAVNQAEQDITKLKQDVAGIPDVVFKDGRFTDIKLTVEQTEESLTNKAEKTEVKELSEDLTGVKQTVNTVKQTSDENSSKITTLDTRFKDMKLGRTNLIENSGDFQDASLWIANNTGGELEVVAVNGEKILRVKGTTRQANSYKLEPNTEYVYSAMVKLPIDHWNGFNDPLHSWTAQGTNLHTAKRKWTITPEGTIKANEWTYIAVGIHTADGEPTMFTPFFFSETLVNANQDSYIKFVQITKGNQPVTDWIPPISEVVSSKEFTQTTNEIKQTAEENTATITKIESSINNENHLYDSSANRVLPKFINGGDPSPYHIFNTEHKFEGDYSTFKCLDWHDGFYQVGDYLGNNLRGFDVGQDITLSLDLASESNWVEIMVFQRVDDQWTVPTNKFFKFENTDWKRVSYTFKLDNKCKSWMFRIRMDAREENQGKRWWIRNLKLEKGSFATPWLVLSATTQELNRQTNEIKQTVGENSAKITQVQTKVNNMNDDVTNLMIDSSTFQGAVNTLDGGAVNRWWLRDSGGIWIPKETFEGSAIAETQRNWKGIAYNFGDLVKRGVVKLGDEINYSMYIRVKNLPDGALYRNTFYFKGFVASVDMPSATNQWKRIEISFIVTEEMMSSTGESTTDWMRVEGWESLQGEQFYQQSKPQITIGNKLYTWRPAPEDTNTIISKTNEIRQTVDSNTAKITATEGTINNFKGLNNLAPNSTMNDATNGVPDYWIMPYDQWTVLPPFEDKRSSNILKIWASGLTEALIRSAQTHKIPAKANTTYTFSVDFYADSNNTVWDYQVPFIIQFYDKDGNRVEYQDVSIESCGVPIPFKYDKWQRLVLTYKPTNTAITHMDFRPALFKNGQIHFREFQIEEGSQVTGWGPSQADLVKAKVFHTKTSEIEQTVNSIRTGVASITATQGQHGQLIQENKSSINQLNNQISLKIEEKQMQDYVGKLGEPNLLLNAPFNWTEMNEWGNIVNELPSLDKWGTWTADTNKGTFEPTRSVRCDGYNSTKISCSNYEQESSWTGLNQVIGNIDPFSEYTYRGKIFVTNKDSIDNGLYAEIKAWNGDQLVGAVGSNINEVLENGVWKEYSVTIPPIKQAVTHMQITAGVRRNGTIYVSNLMFQKGSTKSVFIPNPKDMGDYQAMVREIGKKVATSEFNQKITTMQTAIDQTSNAINLRAEKTEVYTRNESNDRYGSKAMVESHNSSILLMADAINQRVEKGNIASTINQTAQSVLIQAEKIYLNGYIEAKHLKAQTLQGVTIQTAPSGSGANQIRLNAQNMTLYGNGQARGYFGFINRSDNNITSALILGNDYASSGSLDGSLVLEQTTIDGYQWTNSVASIGIATGRNGNDIAKRSYINFYRYNGNMDIRSEGSMQVLTTNGDIEIDASSSNSSSGFIYIKSSKDIDMIAKRGQYRYFTSDNRSMPAMTLVDRSPTSSGDVDLTLANLIMLRMSRNINYVGDGLQIKSSDGSGWRDIKLRTLRAMENISATGRMWAVEFIPTSSRKLKTNIQDLPFSALDKINSVNIKQYHMIRDVERFESGESITIPVNYGMIAEESDDVFTTLQKDAVTLYSSVSISIQAIQEVDFKVKNLNFDHGMLKQEVDTLREQLEAEKKEKLLFAKRMDEQEKRIEKLEFLYYQLTSK